MTHQELAESNTPELTSFEELAESYELAFVLRAVRAYEIQLAASERYRKKRSAAHAKVRALVPAPLRTCFLCKRSLDKYGVQLAAGRFTRDATFEPKDYEYAHFDCIRATVAKRKKSRAKL